MKARKILFPTDFSHTGDAALAYASMLARDTGAELLIVHAEEPPTAYGGGEMYYGLPEPDTDALKEMLARVAPVDPNIRYTHRLVSGPPADAVVELANQEQVDMIVMGTHGRTGLSRLLMGSVAESIVRHAHCPVVTIKSRAEAAE